MRHYLSHFFYTLLMLAGCSISFATEELPIDPADIYPQGRLLLFSVYTLDQPQLDTARTDGLTSIGPYHGKRARISILERMKASGLPGIYSVGPKIDFTKSPRPSLDAAGKLLTQDMQRYGSNPSISVWGIRNEELRHWRKDEMQWLQQATEIIREHDPYKRPIMMYEPNHRKSDGLIKTGVYTDFIAKGSYANHVGMKDKRTWMRWSLEQTVNAAKEINKIPIAVLWMARDQSPGDVEKIHSWTRHDVYLSLVLGAKGILVWSGHKKREGFSEHFQNFYAGYISAARELNGTQGLAQVFLFGNPNPDADVKVIGGPASQSFKYLQEEMTYPSLSFVQLDYEDRHFLFIVNSVDNSLVAEISNLPRDLQFRDEFTGEMIEATNELEMAPYEVKALSWD